MENTEKTKKHIDINNKSNYIYKINPDKKPICMHGFIGTRNNCLRFLHHSVKPIIGVVKYDFSTWLLFPKNIQQAKELAQKWSDSIEKRKDFINKSVIIFFHLTMKTIRVEVKLKTIDVSNNNLTCPTPCPSSSLNHLTTDNVE